LDTTLDESIQASVDGLLAALELRPLGEDLFQASGEPARLSSRVYGGQLLAQAVVAAAATVTGKSPNSLHAAFVDAGAAEVPVELAVERVRDGRSLSTRQVRVRQDGRTLLTAIVSFHSSDAAEPDVGLIAPAVRLPEQVPLLQTCVDRLPSQWRELGTSWIDRPPPIELRMEEPPTFLGGPSRSGPRSHWMRLPRMLGDGSLNMALLAYSSDFFLMDMAFQMRPDAAAPGGLIGVSLDHTIWFHQPVRFDEWHLHTQEAVALKGDRGLARGAIHDLAGRHVATVNQEVLVCQVDPR
jgi:acyl-CoA thioesterase-2